MIDETTGRAISLVDLDTVKPGLIHYDIGDCMRSGCNPLGEETEQWEAVQFRPEIGAAILEGYLTQARNFLTEADYDYLFDSIRLLALELGVRFFTDYLDGNVYFKVKHPQHNLQRALVQFKLTKFDRGLRSGYSPHHPGYGLTGHMTKHSFSLIPFPAPNLPKISITGEISLQDNSVLLRYSLSGEIEKILWPPIAVNPSRKDELWKRTCFEFFLAIKNMPQYWEFNLSPSGDWNAYYMNSYRRVGFREETSIQRLQFESQRQSSHFTLDVIVDLNPIIQQSQLFDVGITAVIQKTDGNETYWALSHPAPFADFHLRESFILGLAGQTHRSQQSALGD